MSSKNLVDFWVNHAFARGQCYCPEMTFNDFDRTFLLGQFWNLIAGPARIMTTPCPNKDWLSRTWRDSIFGNETKIMLQFPAGSNCNLATWQSGGTCLIKQPMPTLGVTLNAAIQKCPNSYWPYGSITCSGAGCEKILMPCNSASECGTTLPCTPVGPVCVRQNRSECDTDYVYNWTGTQMYDALTDFKLYDNGDAFPGCYEATKFFEDIISRARLHFRQTTTPYVFLSGGLNTLRLCMKMDDTFILSTENATLSTDANLTTRINFMDMVCEVKAYPQDTSYNFIQCTSLQAWDGQLDAGRGSVTSASRLDGSFFTEVAAPAPSATEDTAILLAAHTCDGSVHFLPSNPRLHVSTRLPWLNDHISWFFNEIFGIQRCRAQARFSDMSWESFRIRFFDIIGMLYQFILPGPAVPLTSWRLPAMSDWSPNSTTKLVFPATCTYDSWKNGGMCAMQWTGLQSLLKMGITLRAYAKDCGSFTLPEFKIECVGSGCPLFVNPQLCTASTECPTGAQCIDVYQALYKDLDKNSTLRDIMQAFFTLNASSVPDSCGSEDNGRKDLRDFLRYLKGLPSDGLTGTSICMANFTDIFENFNGTLWAEAQATVDGDHVTLHTLLPWTPSGVAPTAPVTTVTVTFQVTGDSSKVADVIKADYPNAEVSVTSSTVTVTLTGSSAESNAATFASDVQNTNSPLSTKLVQNGATPQTSTIAVNPIVNDNTLGTSATALTFSFVPLALALVAFLKI